MLYYNDSCSHHDDASTKEVGTKLLVTGFDMILSMSESQGIRSVTKFTAIIIAPFKTKTEVKTPTFVSTFYCKINSILVSISTRI